jgi:hypothetical protein
MTQRSPAGALARAGAVKTKGAYLSAAGWGGLWLEPYPSPYGPAFALGGAPYFLGLPIGPDFFGFLY